jgi:hypothetical protein
MFAIAMFCAEIRMQDSDFDSPQCGHGFRSRVQLTLLQLEWLAPRFFDEGVLFADNCCVC